MTIFSPAGPHLTTAIRCPLAAWEKNFTNNNIKIETWFRNQWRATPPPFYASVDLRNAGFKLAPIDTNLFPAGFNNLNKAFDPLCIQAVQATLQQSYPDCSRILFIPESHTRNPYYFENVARQLDILMAAGYEVHCGSLREDLTTAENIKLPNGQSFLLQPIKRQDNRISVNDFS